MFLKPLIGFRRLGSGFSPAQLGRERHLQRRSTTTPASAQTPTTGRHAEPDVLADGQRGPTAEPAARDDLRVGERRAWSHRRLDALASVCGPVERQRQQAGEQDGRAVEVRRLRDLALLARLVAPLGGCLLCLVARPAITVRP